MEIRIEAVQIAELFNIKKFRSEFRTEAFSGSTSEVFYALTETIVICMCLIMVWWFLPITILLPKVNSFNS